MKNIYVGLCKQIITNDESNFSSQERELSGIVEYAPKAKMLHEALRIRKLLIANSSRTICDEDRELSTPRTDRFFTWESRYTKGSISSAARFRTSVRELSRRKSLRIGSIHRDTVDKGLFFSGFHPENGNSWREKEREIYIYARSRGRRVTFVGCCLSYRSFYLGSDVPPYFLGPPSSTYHYLH